MKNKKIAILILLTVSACAKPPEIHQVDKSKTFNDSFETTWSRVIQFFTSNNIPIKTIDKSSGVIYAEKLNGTKEEGERYADCGTPGIALILSTKISMNIFVQKLGSTQSKATINTTFSQIRQFDGRTFEANCNSRGTLELQLLSTLGQ